MEKKEKKKVLILRACGLKDEKNECENITSQCTLYGLEVEDHCPKTNEELKAVLKAGKKYDYIYLSSHGSSDGFESEDKVINFTWFQFGSELCDSECMNEDCIVMLSCCRGGLSQIAYNLFYCCDQIAYIVGPRQSLYTHDMLIGFNILFYNLTHRNVDPIVACEKIKAGTDIRFICFDKEETISDPGYVLWTQYYDDTTGQHDPDNDDKAVDSPPS